MDFIIKTFGGLEDVLVEELRALGARSIFPVKRAVLCKGDEKDIYRFNYLLRTAVKVQVPIATFSINGKEDLYNQVKKIDWTEYLTQNQTFVIDSVMTSDLFDHSNFPSLVTKDAIADFFFEKFYKRPNINKVGANLRLNLHIFNKKVTLSWDTSGNPLFMRGYRMKTNEAPMNEVMAAGILKLSGWDMKSPLLDPMCGSGTFLTEAALLAMNIPAGIKRPEFAFQNSIKFNPELWEDVKAEAKKNIKNSIPTIIGRDILSRTLKFITTLNLRELGLEYDVKLEKKDFFKSSKDMDGISIIMNPPYDERLSVDNVNAFYKKIGDQLKAEYRGVRVTIVSTNIPAMKSLGLKLSDHFEIENVKLQYQVNNYDIGE